MKGRQLTAPQDQALPAHYLSKSETICWEHTTRAAELIARAPAVALDATVHVLQQFQWTDVSRRMLGGEQQRFYEKRWRYSTI